MKSIPLVLFFLSSCALYNDFKKTDMNWLGDPKHPSVQKSNKQVTEESQPETNNQIQSNSFIENSSSHWVYSKTKDMLEGTTTFQAKTKDKTGINHLFVIKNEEGVSLIIVEIAKGTLSYRTGHSIEVKLDGEYFIQQVGATKNGEEQIVRIEDSEELLAKFKDKKILSVELLLNDTGKEIYEFDISGLQAFFFE